MPGQDFRHNKPGGGGHFNRKHHHPSHGGGNFRGPHPSQQQQQQQQHQGKDVLRTMLKLVLEKQAGQLYQDGVLKLISFRDCADLAEVKRSVDFDTTAFCDSLCSAIREKIPDVQYIQVDKNNIRNIGILLTALINHELHLGVRGISAQSNSIRDINFLKKLSEFQNLIEVSFQGNPISEKADYRQVLAKRVPQLMGIDCVGVERHPLSLPWPNPSTYTLEQQGVLQWLENFLLMIGHRGPEHTGFMYHSGALFSLNSSVELNFVHRSDSKAVSAALNELRHKARERNRNLVQSTGKTAGKVAKGRSEVCTFLASCVYPRDFIVEHAINSNADVRFLAPGVVVATMHGTMTWGHPALKLDPSSTPTGPDVPLNLCFDRTFALVYDGTEWSITNDMLTLRTGAPDAVYTAGSSHRTSAIAADTGIPPEIIDSVIRCSSSDADFALRLAEVSAVGPDVLSQCCASAGDTFTGVKAALLVARFGAPVNEALRVLSTFHGDLDAACASIAAPA